MARVIHRVAIVGACAAVAATLAVARAETRETADCRAATSLLKSVYDTPNTPNWGPVMDRVKTASDTCLGSLARRVDDCRARFPDREAECRPYVTRQEACTQALDGYAVAIKKRIGAGDLHEAAADPAEDYARGKRYEPQCLEATGPGT
jgi:hypothetical protein